MTPNASPESVRSDLNAGREVSTDTIFTALNAALAAGSFGLALGLADEICRPERAKKAVDLLPRASACPALRGYSAEALAPLADRIDQYNAYVSAR